MSTRKDQECKRLARSYASSPERQDYVPRAQTSGERCRCLPEERFGRIEGNELSSGGSNQHNGLPGVPGPTQETLAGFQSKVWTPHGFQLRGIEWLHQTEAALFLPPGLGKSSIGLATILALKQAGLPHRTLLLAPLMVCRTTWMTEPQKWLQFQGLRIGFAHGPDKRLILNDPYWDIVLMNYDGIEWAAAELLKGHNFDILLCDEITRLKNTNSKRYKLFKPLAPTFKIRWGFTGTPAANGLIDLFGQVYVLDLGKRLGRYITHFRVVYFHQVPFDQYRYYITPTKAQQLTDKLKDLAMYVEPKEWLELPEFFYVPWNFDMEPKAWAGYKQLEEDFILKLESEVVKASNAGVLTSKLRQYTGGAVYISEGDWRQVDTGKLDKLDDLIDQMAGEPLMVAYQFDHEMQRIKDRHPEALVLKGGMTAKAVVEIVDQWNTGNCPLLLVQPASAALGLNLQFGGAAVAWFTMTYNLEEFIQLNKRLHRQGQTKVVRCYMITANKSIDVVVGEVLKSKDAVQEDLFTALKLKLGKV